VNPDFRVALDVVDILQAGADTIVAELMVLHGGAKAVDRPIHPRRVTRIPGGAKPWEKHEAAAGTARKTDLPLPKSVQNISKNR
jgi:hypothetical protein